MPIPLILIFGILCFILMHNIKRNTLRQEQKRQEFWALESKANQVRRQDISSLDYIHLDVDALPFGVDSSPEAVSAETILLDLQGKNILNLNRYSNTELNMLYGPANFQELSACDEAFTKLIRTLYQWACHLMEHDFVTEAIQVANYSISIGSDISGCYYMLIDYYIATNNQAALQELKTYMHQLNPLQANSIKDYLNKSLK